MGQLPRDRRITQRREIMTLLCGPRFRVGPLDLYWCPAVRERSRATCITPKFGHSSVERNRLRRRLKALLGEIVVAPRSTIECDLLVRIWPAAYDLGFAELASHLEELVGRMEHETVTGTGNV